MPNIYALIGDRYYSVQEKHPVVIPAESDYKKDTVKPVYRQINGGTDVSAEMQIYNYVCNILESENDKRCEDLVNWGVEHDDKGYSIERLLRRYMLQLNYRVVDSNGNIYKKGSDTIYTDSYSALLMNDIAEDAKLTYRRAMLFNGKFYIQIPRTQQNISTTDTFILKIDSIELIGQTALPGTNICTCDVVETPDIIDIKGTEVLNGRFLQKDYPCDFEEISLCKVDPENLAMTADNCNEFFVTVELCLDNFIEVPDNLNEHLSSMIV